MADISERDKVEKLEKEVKRLSEKNDRLRRAVDELSTLNELALDIGGSVDSEEIMRTIISRSIRSIGAEQGDITLVDEEREDNAETLVRSMVSSKSHSAVHLNRNLLGWMQINKKPLTVNDPEEDSRFQNVEWEESIHSLLSAPLMIRSKLIGILTIYNKKEEEAFTDQDRRLLSIIATQSAQVLENARLYEEEQALKKMRHELELAAKIQRQLLPDEEPQLEGYGLCGKNITARSVGGDYYDFFPLDDQKWAICLGDVSGKGMPASLLMSNLQAMLHGQMLYQPSPAVLLKNANRLFYRNTDAEKFVTFFLGILDTSSHTLHYSSGGHEHPFLLHPNDGYSRLKSGGLPLGVMDNQEYEEDSVTLSHGDKLLIYSDGIIDSRNEEDERFGEKKLQGLLTKEKKQNGNELMNNIFEASLAHNANPEPFDDMTMVVLSRKP
ncbi:MAG: PP2C family protein-serine/threonine phosphatase [Balneolaceae bacterium]|nr:PP2C family protein-serine/threonine phosphatase [Balneolaceae bacterium]